MTLKRIRKIVLYIAALIILSSSVLIYMPVADHSCCTVEYYCYPCMIAGKLRDTLRLGAVLDSATWLFILVLFFELIIATEKSNHASNLVELKVRMNN